MIRLTICSILGLTLIGVSATRASAQVPGSPFAIDQIVTDFNNSGLSTGLTVPPCDPPQAPPPPAGLAPQACKQIDANGNTQELGPKNANTTKIGVIHNAGLNMLNTTNPNANVDLNAGWIQTTFAPVSPGGPNHLYLYFGWRRDSNNGSGLISLEIQKSAAGGPLDNCNYDSPSFNPALCNPWAGRQAGDVIFLWDQQGGSSTTIIAAPITGPAGFNQILNIPDCSHEGECEDLTVQNIAHAVFGSDCGTGFQAGQCGEMVIDLTALGVFPLEPTTCVGLANFIPGTVTGNSNTADYKDVILAPFPPVSSCGTVTVTKRTVAPDGTTLIIDNTLTTFAYTMARTGGVALRFASSAAAHPEDGPAPQTQIKRPNAFNGGQPGLTGCVNTTTCGGPVISHADLIADDDFTLAEDGPPVPWVKVSIICTVPGVAEPFDVTLSGNFPVQVNVTTACVITNKLQLGNPTPASVQRAKIADSIQLTNITAGGLSNSSPALARNTVRVKVYTGACGAAGVQVATFDLTLTFTAPVAGQQTASTDFTTDVVVGSDSTHFWSAQWDGDTFNNPITVAQSCTTPGETVNIDFTPTQ